MSSVVTVGFCSSTRWDLASTAQDQKKLCDTQAAKWNPDPDMGG